MSPGLFPYIGFLQFKVEIGNAQVNSERLLSILTDLNPREGTLLVLPELWAYGLDYRNALQLAGQTSEILKHLQDIALKRGIYFTGSLFERSANQVKPYNTLFVSGPDGVIGTYRKQHLFVYWDEDHYVTSGSKPGVIDTPHGLLAGLVCYDLRFPDLVAVQTFEGAEILTVSAQWPISRIDQWRILLQSRAVENQIFVVASNSCGLSGEKDFGGHSMIVAPDGKIIVEAGYSEEAQTVPIAVHSIEKLRSRFCTVGERPCLTSSHEKIVERNELLEKLKRIRKQKSKVAFTNGCFDIFHSGHVDYLEKARDTADCLVVGLNSNRSVRILKGNSRPVNDEKDRARVLASLQCVDFVTIFDEETPKVLISSILPDILVKGADWPEDRIVGADEVKQAGGKVLRIPFTNDVSTSKLIQRVNDLYTNEE